MRVAVFGTGRMGAFRAERLRARPDVDEVLVASGDPARGRPVAAVLESRPDAVVVSSATPDHAAHVAACAARGIPVLCEKPLGLTLGETLVAIEAAERAGTLLQVAFMRRFDTGFAAAQRAVAEGRLGVLYCAHLASHDHEPSPPHFIPGSGGIFRDLLVHDLDMARWLTGLEVDSVLAVGSVRRWRRYEEHGDVDTAAALLTLDGGVPVTVTATRHHPHGYDVHAEVVGSEDAIAVGPAGKLPHGFLERFGQAFDAELDAWLEAVRGERENPCPGVEALRPLQIAVACDRSRAQGRVVRIAEVGAG